MFGYRRPPDDDEPEPVGPDDAREWRSEATERRRLDAELLRVKRMGETYRKMEQLWNEMQRGWQDYRNKMKWVDTRTGKIIE